MNGENVSERRTQKRFARLYSTNFDVKDASCSGRLVTDKVDEILQLVEKDRHASCQEIFEKSRLQKEARYWGTI